MKIFFATNRQPTSSKLTNYGKHFNKDGLSVIRFGQAIVSGNKVTVKTAPEKLFVNEFETSLVTDKTQLGSSKVFHDIRNQMVSSCRDTLIFVHGYNVSFKEAIKSAAKLGKQLEKVDGGKGVNIALFSWPSDGSMKPYLSYSNDRRDAAASGPGLARALLKFHDFLFNLEREDYCDRRVHLMCHSMGNYVLRHALQEFLNHSSKPMRIFDQICLMAPDEDDDAFEHDYKLKLLPKIARHVNVYFNRGDRAMAISDLTKANPERLGDDGPRHPFQIPAKVTVIDCTNVVSGIVEHSYYVETPKVVEDITSVLSGKEPQDFSTRTFVEDRNRYQIVK